MKINGETLDYLLGKKISNGHLFKVERSPVTCRSVLLRRLVKGKRTLHVGCADHLELIKEKRLAGTYMHDILLETASLLIGVDTNAEALQKMSRMGINDLYTPEACPKMDFDIVVVPDVIEHIGDVNQFLGSIKDYGAQEIILTTPNAFRLYNRMLWQGELINTDHRCWFSPYTLCKICVEAGFEVDKIWYMDRLMLREPVRSCLKWMFPLCRDGLAVSLRPA